MPKVLIFAGAPEADWSSPDSLLLLPPSTPPAQPAPAAPAAPTSASASSSTSAPAAQPAAVPSWRSLPLHRQPLTTGYSQPHGLPSDFLPPAHFFSLALDAHTQEPNNDTTGSQDLLSQQFYDYSLALHHDLASSQLPTPAPSASQPNPTRQQTKTSFNTTTGIDSFLTETTDSFQDTTAEISTFITYSAPRPPLPTSHHLSDLEDIPPAPDLLRLAPQTVTVNLIAGVISVSAPRSVTTRWGNDLALVEVLIGDETRAGFGVTFWLPANPDHPAKSTDQTGGVAAAAGAPTQPSHLRRQDVVLLQNVALHVFRGKVYGQSLRKGLTRTTVLYRRRLGEGDEGGYYRPRDLERSTVGARDGVGGGDGGGGEGGGDGEPMAVHPQLVKTRRVWEWVLRFVGGEERTTARGKVRRGWDALPDDTQ
ncbi:hypothetical protein CORC01_10431 [Colletotrichum orchidophilum]|uniref:Nucleic acid-binding protein n=1 Tax=Colletotrichum orchidophilum TaxID=1209926 RepID=A0A1G4AYR0_9PEZI|nr:uncharacterized protein CORC01_10431 [Colletotrichum orchidophilum]OHE94271.1 hypothetical protein CORC01_10431 [Colletotrichum orchidophilum]